MFNGYWDDSLKGIPNTSNSSDIRSLKTTVIWKSDEDPKCDQRD